MRKTLSITSGLLLVLLAVGCAGDGRTEESIEFDPAVQAVVLDSLGQPSLVPLEVAPPEWSLYGGDDLPRTCWDYENDHGDSCGACMTCAGAGTNSEGGRTTFCRIDRFCD